MKKSEGRLAQQLLGEGRLLHERPQALLGRLYHCSVHCHVSSSASETLLTTSQKYQKCVRNRGILTQSMPHGTLPKIHISYFIHHIFLSISICPREPIHRCTFLTLHFSSPQCQVCGRLWQIDRQLFDIFCFQDRAVLFKTGPKKEEVSVHLVTLFVPRQVAEPSWRGRFSGIWHWKAALVVVTWSRDRWQDWQGASKVELPRCHGDRFPSSGEHQCWPNHLDVWLLLCKLGGEGSRILRTC